LNKDDLFLVAHFFLGSYFTKLPVRFQETSLLLIASSSGAVKRRDFSINRDAVFGPDCSRSRGNRGNPFSCLSVGGQRVNRRLAPKVRVGPAPFPFSDLFHKTAGFLRSSGKSSLHARGNRSSRRNHESLLAFVD
jgi:hypothetical protein